MREQRPDKWPTDGDRPRRWVVHFIGDTVVVRQYADPAPDEDLTEYPRTVELTRQEWGATHADYGLNLDGQPR
jgi:hypothetical protein